MRTSPIQTFQFSAASCSVLLSFLAACSHHPDVSGTTPAATPREALIHAMTAINDRDESAATTAFYMANPQERDAIKAMFEFSQATEAFHQAFAAAYGADAWAKYQDPTSHTNEDGSAFHLKFHDGHVDIAKLQSVAIEEKGDDAFTDIPELAPNRAHMVKVPGGWLMDAACWVSPDTEPADQAKMMRSLAGIIQKYQKVIGKPGMKREDIEYELGRAGMGAMGVTTDDPHRFDIDHL